MAQRPLRVLEVFQPPDGGVPVYVRHLTRGLRARGHEVVAAGPAHALVRPDMEESGARYVPIDIAPEPRPWQDLKLIRKLVGLLRSADFDVVHVHGQKAGLLGRVAALIAGVPAVYTANSFVYRVQMLKERPSARARFLTTRAMERFLGRRSAGIIAVAEEERQAAIEDGLSSPDKVHLVLTGVDVDTGAQPDPRLLEFRGEGPLMGFVATLRDQKGLPVLLDALEMLAAEGRAPRTAIVGEGPMWDEVERRLAAGPIGRTTLLMGFQGPSERYLAALDAYVLPSLWEGLPLAVLEAMFMGLPTVATAVNGTPEAVLQDRTGLLVPPGDARALAEAMAQMAADPEMRRRMGDAAREEAARRFTVERMVDETESVLLGLR